MLNKKDFEKIKHNPFGCKPGQFMWQRYPELARHKALSQLPEISRDSGIPQPEERELDDMVKLVVLISERHGNPLGDVKDFEQRIDMALEALGIKKHGRTIWFYVSAQHWWYRSVLFEYFRMLNDDEYNLWASLKMNFAVRMHLLRMPLPVSADEKYANMINKLTDSAEPLLKRIQSLEARLFADERIKEIISSEAVATDGHAEKFAEEFIPQEI